VTERSLQYIKPAWARAAHGMGFLVCFTCFFHAAMFFSFNGVCLGGENGFVGGIDSAGAGGLPRIYLATQPYIFVLNPLAPGAIARFLGSETQNLYFLIDIVFYFIVFLMQMAKFLFWRSRAKLPFVALVLPLSFLVTTSFLEPYSDCTLAKTHKNLQAIDSAAVRYFLPVTLNISRDKASIISVSSLGNLYDLQKIVGTAGEPTCSAYVLRFTREWSRGAIGFPHGWVEASDFVDPNLREVISIIDKQNMHGAEARKFVYNLDDFSTNTSHFLTRPILGQTAGFYPEGNPVFDRKDMLIGYPGRVSILQCVE